MRALGGDRGLWIALIGLALLLASVATLEYHWIGRLSAAEEERLSAGLDLAARRFARDFDSEVTRAFLRVQSGGESWPPKGPPKDDTETRLANGLAAWREESSLPNLFSDLLWITHETPAGADEDAEGVTTAKRLTADGSTFEPYADPSLATLHSRVAKGFFPWHRFDRELDAVLVPFIAERSWSRSKSDRETQPKRRHWLALRLARDALEGEILPRLASTHFGVEPGNPSGFDFGVLVTETGQWIFRSSDRIEAVGVDAADARAPMLRFVGPEEDPTVWRGSKDAEPAEEIEHPGPADDELANEPRATDLSPDSNTDRGGLLIASSTAADSAVWQLVVNHSKGSLQAATAGPRQRNLVLSATILVLLGAAVTALVLAGRRHLQLAHDQVEFIAGISHEIRTPLTAMQSLADNLADGIVRSEDEVRRHGKEIARQTARLSSHLEHALHFTGSLMGKDSMDWGQVDVAEVVDRATEDCRDLAERKGARVDVRYDDDLPSLSADRRALVTAVRNLISNAIKYGGDEPVVEVAVRRSERADSIEISVADHGIGVSAAERSRLFEPFFRSARARHEQIEGAGLGLSLVRSIVEGHGGHVDVDSSEGAGSRFAIVLPASEAGPG